MRRMWDTGAGSECLTLETSDNCCLESLVVLEHGKLAPVPCTSTYYLLYLGGKRV